MKIVRFLKPILLLLLVGGECLSQRTTLMQIEYNKQETDSLVKVLDKTSDPKEKVLIYKELTWKLRTTDAEEIAIDFANKGIALAKKIGYKKAEADITRFKGMITWNFLHQNITLDLYEQALKLSKEIDDKEGEAYCYDRLGIAYYYRKSYDTCENNFQKAESLFKQLNNQEGLSYIYNHYNWLYTAKHQYEIALDYGRKSLEIRKLLNDYTGISNAYSDIGVTYYESGNLDSAIFFLHKALAIDKQKNLPLTEAVHAGILSELYFKTRNYENALVYGNESYNVSYAHKIKRQVLKTAGILADVYEEKRNYPKALEYYHIEHKLKDSLFNDDLSRRIAQQEMQYEYDKQERERDNLEKLEKVVLTAIIIIISIVAYIIFLERKRKQKDNEILRLKNKEINDQKEEITKQASELQELNKMKDSLFSVISHDLRGPVSTTTILLEMLKDKSLEEESFFEALPKLIDQLRHTSALLDNLLLWAKSLMDGKTVAKQVFDLSQITKANIELIAIQLKEKGVSINNRIPSPLYVDADSSMMEVVLRNLLSNAMKFCEEGDYINITASELTDFVQINIEDSGVGIAADKQVFLFKPKIATTRGTANEVGTGMGLLLCKEFVERNNGKIWLESEPGKGTIFHFTVPKPEKGRLFTKGVTKPTNIYSN